MSTPMGEYDDTDDTADTNDQDAVVETPDDYGPDPEPEGSPAPDETIPQNEQDVAL